MILGGGRWLLPRSPPGSKALPSTFLVVVSRVSSWPFHFMPLNSGKDANQSISRAIPTDRSSS